MTEVQPAPSSRTWWQRQRLWLLGAVVFGGWALYMPYHEAREADQRDHPSSPITVAPGTWVSYEGARWRLLGVEPGEAKSHQREDAIVLVAHFELIPDPGTQAKSLDRCVGRLSDPQGRHWSADSFDMLGTRQKLPNSCGRGFGANFHPIEAIPGKPWQFEQAYQVPRSLDPRSLQPEIVMPWPKLSPVGSFLRFQR